MQKASAVADAFCVARPAAPFGIHRERTATRSLNFGFKGWERFRARASKDDFLAGCGKTRLGLKILMSGPKAQTCFQHLAARVNSCPPEFDASAGVFPHAASTRSPRR